MLESIRKAVFVLPAASVEVAASVVTVAAFLWLLANGFLRPIAILLLELYLAF